MSQEGSYFSHGGEKAQLAELDAAIARGIADAGRVKPAAEVLDGLETKYRAMSGEGDGIP
jgi:hypothetical protein